MTTQPEEAPLDLAAARAIIDAQRTRVRTTAYSDDRVIFGIWATAWGVGYGVLWAVSGDGVERMPWGAWAVFGVLILAGVVTTILHSARRMSGMDGVSRRTGAMYGWSWMVAFTAAQVLLGGLAAAGLPPEGMTLAANGISALIVGILYMAGGALWQDRAQFALGVWMALVAAVATLVGLPGTFAVMCLAGGGGMAVGALLAHVAQRRGNAPRRGGLA
ncbi:hypothetical protein [Cellulomonas triticagri]|uniref:Uncharacterized protein n=1 Tax=Cellulomonas triticagri TaxID=2483352 RepID=A0A3M2IYB5_9CELL|nr:hypothetical protein [Cellulomonas triticagri]RMI04640.1 hypothetical protein EBM89_18220 [Cellulomonas triticagri]